MRVVRDHTAQEFLQHASDLLYRHEAMNSLMLGLCERLLIAPAKASPLFLRVVDGSKTLTAAFQASGMNLVLTFAEAAHLEELGRVLFFELGVKFPGVVAPKTESETFANLWAHQIGKISELSMDQMIYQLDRVIPPDNIHGAIRKARADEIDRIFTWLLAFQEESIPPSDQRSPHVFREIAESNVQNQTAYFWIVDGNPVSMALANRPTRNGITVNGVYTPPVHRKKGYASGVVAGVSQAMLDSGKKFCVLYTDLKNPSSNKIYKNIGYREVGPSQMYAFI